MVKVDILAFGRVRFACLNAISAGVTIAGRSSRLFKDVRCLIRIDLAMHIGRFAREGMYERGR